MRAKPLGPVLITTLPRGMTATPEAQVGDQVSPSRGEVTRPPQLESGAESGVESPWVLRLLSLMEAGPRTKSEVARELGKAKPSRHLHETMARLVASGALGHTLPDKPNSRHQRYRLTPLTPDTLVVALKSCLRKPPVLWDRCSRLGAGFIDDNG